MRTSLHILHDSLPAPFDAIRADFDAMMDEEIEEDGEYADAFPMTLPALAASVILSFALGVCLAALFTAWC